MKYYKKQFYFVGTRHGTSLHPNGILGFWMGVYDNCNFCGDAPWHVRTGVGFWMGFMIIGIFYGTMCNHPYI